MTLVRYIGIEGLEKSPAWEAAQIIKNGGVIIYPTETLYGIGADATNEKAAKKVLEIKGKLPGGGLIVLLSREMLDEYIIDWQKFSILMDYFSPGPLTYIANPVKGKFAGSVLKNGTVAFRISSSWFAELVINLSGVPLISTSANISDQPPLKKPDEIIETFNGVVDGIFVFPGKILDSLPSTIVDVTNFPDEIKIIREGQIPANAIKEVLKTHSQTTNLM